MHVAGAGLAVRDCHVAFCGRVPARPCHRSTREPITPQLRPAPVCLPPQVQPLGAKRHLTAALIRISLMNNGAQRLLRCSFATAVFSSVE